MLAWSRPVEAGTTEARTMPIDLDAAGMKTDDNKHLFVSDILNTCRLKFTTILK